MSWKGARRPGHFNGVGQIVSKLFDIVRPHRAYFGMKDFQQIAVIKNMVKQLHYELEIVSCPIIRETDGLAHEFQKYFTGTGIQEKCPAYS